MKSVTAILITIFVIFTIIQIATTIRCYLCNSYYQQDCADFFDNTTINTDDCNRIMNANNTICRKVIQEVHYAGQWNVRYIRQCALQGDTGEDEFGSSCKDRAGTYRVKVRYCHCNTQDGCNGAPSIVSSPFGLLVAVLTCLFLTQFAR